MESLRMDSDPLVTKMDDFKALINVLVLPNGVRKGLVDQLALLQGRARCH